MVALKRRRSRRAGATPALAALVVYDFAPHAVNGSAPTWVRAFVDTVGVQLVTGWRSPADAIEATGVLDVPHVRVIALPDRSVRAVIAVCGAPTPAARDLVDAAGVRSARSVGLEWRGFRFVRTRYHDDADPFC